MKQKASINSFLFFLCLVFGSTFLSMGQTYYYSFGQKKYLTIKPDEFVLKFKAGTTEAQVVSFFNQYPVQKHDPELFYHGYRVNCTNPALIRQQTIVEYLTSAYEDEFGKEILNNNYILLYPNAGITDAQVNQLFQQYNLYQVSKKHSFYIVRTQPNQSPVTISSQMYESGLLDFCHPDFFIKVTPTTYNPNDYYFNQQFYLLNTGQVTHSNVAGTPGADIKVTQAWDITKGANIKIAILDNGVTENHEDLPSTRQIRLPGSNIIYEYDNGNDDPNNPSPNLINPYDKHVAHGQGCAGLAGATINNGIGIAGVAPEAIIVPIKVYRNNSLAPVSLYASAYEFACDNGADILSNSYMLDTTLPVLEKSIKYITNYGRAGKGCLFIACAGNTRGIHMSENGLVNDPIGHVVYPASHGIDDIFVVGASNRHDLISYYSPINEKIDFAGTSDHGNVDICDTCPESESGEVYVLDLPGNYGYNPNYEPFPNAGPNSLDYFGAFGGTSAACAITAGVAALILSVNPELTDNEVQFILKYSADKVGGYNYNWNPDKPGHSKELGYGRINAFNALKLALGQFPVGDITITDNLEWNSNWVLNGNLTIKANATLTVKSEVLFATGKKIVVERGAKLIVDGGSLKGNNCTWKGIELWGNKSQKQLATTQGTVELKNGATIEDAVVAIQTYKPGSRSYSGGIIYAEDAIFRNNQTDVLFEQYANVAAGTEYANLSYFKNCVFETTNTTRFAAITRHAWLNSVNGVKFYGCQFMERRSGLDVLRYGAKGIDAILSGFMVDNHLVTNQPCEFSNMLYGVYASSLSNPARFSVSVRQAIFASWRGVYLRDITTAIAELNQFSVPVYNVAAPAADYRYGLYLDACNTYTVQENQFTSNAHQLSPLTGSSFGLVVNTSGAFANQLYKNSFVGFGVASEAIGINNYGLQDGLQFKCNDYTTSKYDMYVYGTSSTIAASQGSLTDPANNLFSNGGPILVSDLKNDGTHINYYHADPQSNSRVVPMFYTTNKVTLYDTHLPVNTNSCLSFISGEQQSMSQNNINQAHIEVLQLKQLLDQETDNGNTFNLTLDVATTTQENAYINYVELMNTAPYISEEVLKELSQNETAFPQIMVRDIMVANPQSAKDEDIIIKLESRTNPLPQNYLSQIKKGKERVSQLENMRASFNMKKANRDFIFARTIAQKINHDSTDNSIEVRNLYSMIDEPGFRLGLADIHISLKEYPDALQLLDNLYNETPDNSSLAQYISFFQVYITWLQGDKKLDSLNIEDINYLKTFSPSHPAFSKIATLLKLNGDVTYLEPLFIPSEVQIKSQTVALDEKEESTIELYPVPATDEMTVMYDIPDYAGLKMYITDISGKNLMVKELYNECDAFIINVKLFKSGQYYMVFKSGKSRVAVKPFTIVH